MIYLWNFLVGAVVGLIPLFIYAMRKNYSTFEWRIVLTDNLIRIIATVGLLAAAIFVLTFVPEMHELLESSGLLVGGATAGAIGLGIGSLLVTLLPSDS